MMQHCDLQTGQGNRLLLQEKKAGQQAKCSFSPHKKYLHLPRQLNDL
jgi:hypothetical protein